jgi:hypothetical protein
MVVEKWHFDPHFGYVWPISNREPDMGGLDYDVNQEKTIHLGNVWIDEIEWILLFTQKFLLIPKWNDQNTPTHVNSRKLWF